MSNDANVFQHTNQKLNFLAINSFKKEYFGLYGTFYKYCVPNIWIKNIIYKTVEFLNEHFVSHLARLEHFFFEYNYILKKNDVEVTKKQ